MIVAISYHEGDYSLMSRWVDHVVKIGNYQKHKILLIPAPKTPSDDFVKKLKPSFGEVFVQERNPVFTNEHPCPCNEAFNTAARFVSFARRHPTTGLRVEPLRLPFLWMETDAVPLVPTWIDQIEAEFLTHRKPFLGDFVKMTGTAIGGVDHMSGIAVYHPDVLTLAPNAGTVQCTKMMRGQNGQPDKRVWIPWDVNSASQVVPQMAQSALIQHDWVDDPKWRRDVVTPDLLRQGVVVYHPDKKGVLFRDGKDCVSPINGTQDSPVSGLGAGLPPCEEGLTASLNTPHEKRGANTPPSDQAELLKTIEEQKKIIASLTAKVPKRRGRPPKKLR